jgi:hypothetical protein
MALIKSPNNNGPNPTVARTLTPPEFIEDDPRPAELRILDQQWRDAVSLGLLATHPNAINTETP